MYRFLHGRFSLTAAVFVTLLTVFAAHMTECKWPVDHSVMTGRSSDRSGQIALEDALDLLPTTVAACYWSGDCGAAPSPKFAAVLSRVSPQVSRPVIRQVEINVGRRADISNTAIAHKAVTVLLV